MKNKTKQRKRYNKGTRQDYTYGGRVALNGGGEADERAIEREIERQRLEREKAAADKKKEEEQTSEYSPIVTDNTAVSYTHLTLPTIYSV